MDFFNNELDNPIDDDDESYSVSAILQSCNVDSNYKHDYISKSTDIYGDSSLCSDALKSHLTLLGTNDFDDCASVSFSSSQPSLTHTHSYDRDAESVSLDLQSNQASYDGENTVTPEHVSCAIRSDNTKHPEPPIKFANVPTKKIKNRSHTVQYKSAPVAPTLSLSLSRPSRLQEIKDRRRFMEDKYNHHKHVSLTGVMTPLSNLCEPRNSNNSPVKKVSSSCRFSHRNEEVLTRSNAEIMTGSLLALPFVCLTWGLCFAILSNNA